MKVFKYFQDNVKGLPQYKDVASDEQSLQDASHSTNRATGENL